MNFPKQSLTVPKKSKNGPYSLVRFTLKKEQLLWLNFLGQMVEFGASKFVELIWSPSNIKKFIDNFFSSERSLIVSWKGAKRFIKSKTFVKVKGLPFDQKILEENRTGSEKK